MPKIIEHLRADLLECAREILQNEGYETLTIRRVANRCGIAVGTTYNYFPSKDVLAATVMLEDWQTNLQQLHRQCAQAPSALHGLQLVYDSIMAFCDLYRNVWSQYSIQSGVMPFIRAQHKQLIGQLEAEIEPLLECHDCLFSSRLPAFLAESLLNAATRADITFHDLIPILQKLCQPN